MLSKSISIVLCLVMVLSVFTIVPFNISAKESVVVETGASSGTTGDCTWMLDDDGVLTISGNGKMGDYGYSGGPWGQSVKKAIIENGVTVIGYNAFYECKGLINVTIPDSITEIGYGAFCGCTSLKSIVIPNSVTIIDYYAFFCCTGLQSVSIPNSVTSIKDWAFSGCSGLEIVTISDSVTNIGSHAFCDCTRLQSITIPNSVKLIGEEAFSGCTGVQRVKIGNSVTNIGSHAFYRCTEIQRITIPESVTKIEDNIFLCCYALESIEVNGKNKTYDSRNDCNAIIKTDTNTLIVGCKNTVIPTSVTRIWYDAFRECVTLQSITIPTSVTTIFDRAFDGCIGLQNITIPNSVSDIGSQVFYGCTDLQYIMIGNSVTSIGEYAFDGCTSLQSVTIPKSVVFIGRYAFCGCTSLSAIYYGGSKEDWEKINIREVNNCLTTATIHYNSTGSGYVEPIVDLDALLDTDPTKYNNELAIIAANLSLKTYDNDCADDESVRGYLAYDLDFDEAHHAIFFDNNYGGGSLAYTVATRDYDGNGADKLLVIVCQGSTNLYELVKDATAGTKSTYNGYDVYDIVHDFYTDIVETGLPNVIESGKNYKVLLTGHSLGGAAANLTGAVMTGEGTIMHGISANKNDIFCYTFGSVNCIRSDYRIETGYENIHNVYNWLDTFSPKQYGGWLATGMGNGKGKFGRLEAFSHEYRSAADIFLVSDPMKQIISHVNHDMDKYLDAVQSGYVSGAVTVDGETDLIDTYAIVACPVDIEIVNNGQVVARVVDNDVETTVSNISIWVQEDVKYIMFPSNEQFEIKVFATGGGSMDYYVERLHDDQITYSTFTDVQLVNGKTMSSFVDDNINVNDIQLYTMDTDSRPVTEILSDGVEVNPIFVSENNLDLFPDYTVTLTAQSEDNYRWHSTDESVATVVDGVVTTKAIGEVNIIAETENGARAICKVKVTPPIILGDVDGDGEVTIIDATAIQRHLASIPTFSYIEAAADVDEDDEVTIIDATAIQRYLVQLPCPANIGKTIQQA